MKNKEIIDKIDRFEKVQNSISYVTPIQHVKEIERNNSDEPESQLTVHIPRSLMKKLRNFSFHKEMKKKTLVKRALQMYFLEMEKIK